MPTGEPHERKGVGTPLARPRGPLLGQVRRASVKAVPRRSMLFRGAHEAKMVRFLSAQTPHGSPARSAGAGVEKKKEPREARRKFYFARLLKAGESFLAAFARDPPSLSGRAARSTSKPNLRQRLVLV